MTPMMTGQGLLSTLCTVRFKMCVSCCSAKVLASSVSRSTYLMSYPFLFHRSCSLPCRLQVTGQGLYALRTITGLRSLNLNSCLDLGDDDPLAALQYLTGAQRTAIS